MNYRFLSPEQIEHFVTKGYVVLKGVIPKEFASKSVDGGFARLGYDRHDNSTWKQQRVLAPVGNRWDVPAMAPSVWAACCDLMGGEDRVAGPREWSDGFIMNLGVGADKPWMPPSPQATGWHKDGNFFRHFLDSPEQGLLVIICWTDMVHTGGGTFIAPDSVAVVAKFLAEHPEGIHPLDPRWGGLIQQCKEFIELTGEAGDVVLHHPYMLHATSQNVLRVERAITNPAVHLKEPMKFNRPNPSDYSPVESAVLHGLGVDRYDFKPTRQREKITPNVPFVKERDAVGAM
jgi:hypothetical protein